MNQLSKKNEFDINSCKFMPFDVITELASDGLNGVLKTIGDQEASAATDIIRNKNLTREQNKKLKRFGNVVCLHVLKKYYDLIVETGEGNWVLESPIEGFYLERIAEQLGFLPTNELLVQKISEVAVKHYALFPILESDRELYIFFEETRISKDNKHLMLTLTGVVRNKVKKKKFLGLF